MAGEINSSDMNGKIPSQQEVTYHKRGNNEEISRDEFYHRLSVFMQKYGQYVNLNYHIDDGSNNFRSQSIFDNDITRHLAYNMEGYFEQFDKDGSGTISVEELKEAIKNGYDVLVKFLKAAYPLDHLPNNPTNELGEYKDDLSNLRDEIRNSLNSDA